MKSLILCAMLAALILDSDASRVEPSAPLDTLSFGDINFETAHALTLQNSDVMTGLLGEKARRLVPREPIS